MTPAANIGGEPVINVIKVGMQANDMRVFTEQMSMRHKRLEEQSLAFHREIAQRIRDNPELLTRVRDRLIKDINSGRFSMRLTDAMQEWLDLLNRSSLEQILELLADPST
jgi:hypothetical protein